MINIQLPTGNTIMMSAYDYFGIEEKDLHVFYQSCIADNMGVYLDDPFTNKSSALIEIKVEEEEEIILIDKPNNLEKL